MAVTVCGASCAGADVAAKAAFLLDRAGPGWLDAHGLPGRFVTPEGSVTANRAWSRSLGVPVSCI
jgi:thiamine biosynthesis lipoprotein ApbE